MSGIAATLQISLVMLDGRMPRREQQMMGNGQIKEWLNYSLTRGVADTQLEEWLTHSVKNG